MLVAHPKGDGAGTSSPDRAESEDGIQVDIQPVPGKSHPVMPSSFSPAMAPSFLVVSIAAHFWSLLAPCGGHILKLNSSSAGYQIGVWSGADLDEDEHSDVQWDEELAVSLRGSATSREENPGVDKSCTRSIPVLPPVPDDSWKDIPGEMPRRVLVLGAMDSGTNLLQDVLDQHFPNMLDFSRKIWKHSLDTSSDLHHLYATLGETSRQEDWHLTTVLIMVRTPIAQVHSWAHAPYALKQCVNRDWVDMSLPCQASLAPRVRDCGDIRSKYHTFRNTMSVYNAYMRQYHKLVADARFGNVLFVEYEDLVYNTKARVEEFADELQLPMPSEVVLSADPAKTHGDAVGHDEAIAKIEARDWFQDVGGIHIVRSLCEDLDKTLVEDFVENSNRQEAEHYYSYTWDCAIAS